MKGTLNMEKFIAAYVAALLWSECDEDGTPFDRHHSSDDIAPDAMGEIRDDCMAFYSDTLPFIACDIHQAGTDFALTRNGHGAGFWDGKWREGQRLTEMAKVYSTQGLYRGDDGLLYVHN